MPEKKDSKKVMTMLERMGMIRKVDETPDDFQMQDDMTDEATEPSYSSTYNERPVTSVPDSFWEEAPKSMSDTEVFQPVSEVQNPVTAPEPVKPAYSVPDPFSAPYTENKMGDGDLMNEHTFWEATPASEAPAPPPETYTDRYMDVNDLYVAFSMRTSGTDTIYLVEDYMKTLPDSLPAESRRNIIMKIIGASGFDFDRLLGDGIDRVNKLNEYASQFAQRTDDYVAKCNGELEALEAQMQQIRSLIDKRKALHKQQFFSIETEAQRLKEILDFITK